MVGSLEGKARPGLAGVREESALNMFKQMDLRGKAKEDTTLRTVHQNTISTVRAYAEAGGAVRKFSSMSLFSFQPPVCALTADVALPASGVDGRVVIWST